VGGCALLEDRVFSTSFLVGTVLPIFIISCMMEMGSMYVDLVLNDQEHNKDGGRCDEMRGLKSTISDAGDAWIDRLDLTN